MSYNNGITKYHLSITILVIAEVKSFSIGFMLSHTLHCVVCSNLDWLFCVNASHRIFYVLLNDFVQYVHIIGRCVMSI